MNTTSTGLAELPGGAILKVSPLGEVAERAAKDGRVAHTAALVAVDDGEKFIFSAGISACWSLDSFAVRVDAGELSWEVVA